MPSTTSTKECRIEGCSKTVKRGRAVCSMHAARIARHGDAGTVKHEKRTARGVCSITDCGQLDSGPHGLCQKHRTRLRRHGDPAVVLVTEYQRFANGHVSYSTVHQRVKDVHGPAWRHLCRHCMTSYASDWAYDHNDPDELRSARGLAYSTDPERYIPLCRPCHRRFDAAYNPRNRDERGRFAGCGRATVLNNPFRPTPTEKETTR